jgi:pimeloyl-ACP methyl ester carboxylesterase
LERRRTWIWPEFQSRARLLADLGTIERGKRFSGLLRELLLGLIRTYGVVGGVRALRNMNIVLRKLLPEIAALDLLARPPRVMVPVHYVFGEQDALTSDLDADEVAGSNSRLRTARDSVCAMPATWSISTSRKSCDQSWRKQQAPSDPNR